MQSLSLLAYIITATVTYSTTPLIARFMRHIGHVGIDAHKPSKPKIPTSCGISIVLGLILGSCLLILFNPFLKVKILAFMASVVLAMIVGLIDDFKVLGAIIKTALTVISIVPIILAACLYPDIIVLGKPEVPVIGRLRLTIVYWALLPLAIAGPANAVNMLDVLNGVMPITCSIASLTLLISAIILGREDGMLLSGLLLVALLAYIPYNKYPAKVFSGDAGSLSVGAALGAIAVLSRMEIVTMAALSPHITNAFYIIAFIKGLKERREIPRPVVVCEDGTIVDSRNPRAPITLVRILAGTEGAKEPEIIKSIVLMGVISSFIALSIAIIIAIGD